MSSLIQQQVQEGYKKTEIGVIPEEWSVDSICNLCSISTGNKNTQDKINDGLYPFFVRSETVERINSYSFDGEAVLTAGDGVGTGKIFHYINGKCDIHQRVYKMSAFKEKLDGFYFYKYFSSYFYDRIMSMTAKSSVDSVRREMIANMMIAVPPKKEQISIANALSNVDTLVSSIEKLIIKKRAIKRAAMQQLLTGKKRLQDFEEKWKTVSMHRDADLKARIGWQALTTAEYLDQGEYYLVTGTDFKGGRVNWHTCHYVNEWRYSQDKNIQLKKGDILLTKDGTIGKVGYVDSLEGPATLNSGVFVIRPIQNAFHPLFLFYVLSSRIFDDFLCRITAGSTITHLYQKDLATFEFLAPSNKEQKHIASVISSMDDEIRKLEESLKKTKNLKIGMMQELLTGKTRLI